MIRGQVLATPPHDAVLERLPHAVTGRPRHADVVPLAVVDEEGQLRDLQRLERRTFPLMRRHGESGCPSLCHYCIGLWWKGLDLCQGKHIKRRKRNSFMSMKMPHKIKAILKK